MSADHRIICGDARMALSSLPDDSVQVTVTSPPYFGHRNYGAERQLGLEETVDEYVARMRQVLYQLLRVTAKSGACFVVIGDTYRSQRLLLVPHRIALAADQIGWFVRNDLIWKKLDPPPESARNRWRSAHEHILFLTKRPTKYTFHADAIRIPYSDATLRRWGNGQVYGGTKSERRRYANDSRMRHGKSFVLNPNGCIPTDVWSLPSGDSPVRHYATFSDRLIRPIIVACSSPGDWVLDPFVGSGTTCRVAKVLGRRSIGIELNPEYAAIAGKALGCEVETETAACTMAYEQVSRCCAPRSPVTP
ncbi:MAG: DNA-methyltransferase [Planctomycetaceae bacterium]